jgi:Arc/MetJ family transcription regulator
MTMRSTVNVDDNLVDKAMRLSGFKSKRETVEEALKLLVRTQAERVITLAHGRPGWGDAQESRLNEQ